MVKLLESGRYRLVETTSNLKALMLTGGRTFLWKNYGCSGKIQQTTKLDTNQICCVLAANNYRLYNISDEQGLTNGTHLELYVGKSKWQSYLLAKGLPGEKGKKAITKINEVITKVRKKNETPVN